jgi:CRP/FNR family transcriptional regulator, dissimilatory nitrate respiration regulator
MFGEVYHCDATADLPSTVAAFPKRELRAALRADADLAARFLALFARQVQELRARLELRNIRSARERVLAWLELVDSGPLAPPPDGRPLKDLAAELGLTPEALYRTLARLEREGAIVRAGRVLGLRRRRMAGDEGKGRPSVSGASGPARSPGGGGGGDRRGP